MTKEPKGGKLPERVAKLEQKDETDDQRCDARHVTENERLNLIETALWGPNRDGEGGIVNKLNSILFKMALLMGFASFAGSAIGIIILQHLAKKAGMAG